MTIGTNEQVAKSCESISSSSSLLFLFAAAGKRSLFVTSDAADPEPQNVASRIIAREKASYEAWQHNKNFP